MVTLLRDGQPAGEGTGLLRVLLPLLHASAPAPTVLVLTPVREVVARAVLLVPRPAEDGVGAVEAAGSATDLATAQRHPFDPAPGTFAARLRDVEERHPRLWALRHVVLAVGKVAATVLGLAVLLQALVRPAVEWVAGLLPRFDLPSIPWPDVDLPDVSLPGWLQAVLGTAEYWGPVLFAVAVAVHEVRKRRDPRTRGGEEGNGTGGGPPGAHG